MKITIFLSLLLTCFLSGCTSIQHFNPEQSGLQNNAATGERLLIQRLSGENINVEFIEITEGNVLGQSTAAPFEYISIPISDITSISQEKTNALTTLGMVGALAVIVPVSFITGSMGIEWQ